MQTQERTYESGVDFAELLARLEYDRGLLSEVFQIFVEEFPLLHSQLQSAMVDGDLRQVRTTAHTLKGMLASLSFSRASASAFRIERMAAESKPEGIPEELARLGRNAAQAQADLAAVCGEVIR
jgi:HPt (histidine-containing phosphotransfer) domain-containing protein